MLRESALVIFACGMRLGGVLGRGVCACLFDDPCADRVLEGSEEFRDMRLGHAGGRFGKGLNSHAKHTSITH